MHLEENKKEPYEDLGYAKIDHHRKVRQGFEEVVYCPGKETDHLIGICRRIGKIVVCTGGTADIPVAEEAASVGYGASFWGISALLTMINSCSNGITTVNIDNGFGAGYVATQINRLAVQ